MVIISDKIDWRQLMKLLIKQTLHPESQEALKR